MRDLFSQGQVCPAAAITVSYEIPLALERVHAGFPSPAADYAEKGLDIGQHLVKNPSTTFFMKVVGDSMEGLSIHEDDILVIDRAERIVNRCIVVARIGDEFCVKQYKVENGKACLYAAHRRCCTNQDRQLRTL